MSRESSQCFIECFFLISKNFKAEELNINMYDATRNYIEDVGIIYPVIEGRTLLYEGDIICKDCNAISKYAANLR